jgi:hypothetical protein
MKLFVFVFVILFTAMTVNSASEEFHEEGRELTAFPPHYSVIAFLGRKPLKDATVPLPQSVLNFQATLTSKSGATGDRINWDGQGVIDFLAGEKSKLLPRDFFLKGQNNGSPSKHIFTSGINEEAEVDFSPGDAFTPNNDFGPSRPEKKITVSFTSDDAGTPGLVHGFGAIFIDVPKANVAGLKFLDKDNNVIAILKARRVPKGYQLLGAVFDTPIVKTVILSFGKKGDVDDFFFDKGNTPIVILG